MILRLSRRMSLTLVLFALAARAQPTAQQGAYRIAGTVISAIDNRPLQHATIKLLNPENFKPVQTTTSDEDGRFAFTGIPAGNLVLQGAATNYISGDYDEHDGFTTGIITGAQIDTESLLLKLLPQGSITGSIVDEAAEPVQNATIHLFRQSHSFGDGRVVPVASRNTDDLGQFDLPHLGPGTYFLAVTATPWYAIHPSSDPPPFEGAAEPNRRPVLPRLADSIDPSLDVAYSATFYPGTTDPTRAAPIVLRGGESLDLHFQLSPQPAVTITLPRSTPVSGQPQSFPQLSTSFQGQTLPFFGDVRQFPNQTVIAGVAPGDYILSDGRTSPNTANPGTSLRVADRSLTATLPPTPEVAHVHVVVQSAATLPPRSQVVLVLPNRNASASHYIDAKNEAVLDASPGDYSFEVLGGQRYLAVGQVVAGDRPLPSNHIHLAAGETASFTLTVTPRNHTLQGFVHKDGKPFPGAFLLLFPSNEAADLHTFYRQQSDLDGSFNIRNLAPGNYTLVAIEGGWDLDWKRPDALAHYLPAAQTVDIPSAPDQVQTLPQPVPVQPR